MSYGETVGHIIWRSTLVSSVNSTWKSKSLLSIAATKSQRQGFLGLVFHQHLPMTAPFSRCGKVACVVHNSQLMALWNEFGTI